MDRRNTMHAYWLQKKTIFLIGGIFILVLLMIFGIVRFFPSAFSWPPVSSRYIIKSISMVSAQEGWAVGVAGIASDPAQQSSYLLLHYYNGRWMRELPFREGTNAFPSLHVNLEGISMISAQIGRASCRER